MNPDSLKTAITLFTTLLPLSLIIIKIGERIFANKHKKIEEITTICSEIPGIFTEHHLSVKSLYFDNKKVVTKQNSGLIKIFDLKEEKEFTIEKTYLQKDPHVQLIATAKHLCHYPKISKIEEIITAFLKECGLGKDRSKNNYEILEKLATNAHKKISTTIALKKETEEIFAFSKGHPLTILDKCSRIFINGKKEELDSKRKRKLKKRMEKLNKKGQKVIAFAYRGLPKKRYQKYNEDFVENDMVFVGMMGLRSSINKKTTVLIKKLKELNLKTYITSKIKERNAVAIAKDLKIINENYFEPISGGFLETLNEQKLEKIFSNREKDYVFAPVKENEKEKIIARLNKMGEKTIYLDKDSKLNLKKIIEIIENKRSKKHNSKKIIFHALLGKILQIILILFALLLQISLPLSIALVLIIEIFVNLPLEIAIKEEKHSRSPKKSFYILNSISITCLIILIYTFLLGRFGYESGLRTATDGKISTIIFTTLVFIQIIHALLLSNNKKNYYLPLGIFISFLSLYAVFSIPIFKTYLSIKTLSPLEWQIIGFLLLLIVIFELIRNFLVKKNEN